MKALRAVRRRKHLFSTIEKNKTQKKCLELIIETEEGKQYEVAQSLEKLGKIKRIYELIPYISISCEPDIAEELANHVHRKNVSIKFREAYYSILEEIKSVDVSSECSIVPSPKPGKRDVYLDLKVTSLWNLRNIGAYEAQNLSTGKEVNIGIIDTGADYTHDQLKDSFGKCKGYNFVDNDDDPMDGDGHGTHVSGTSCSHDFGVSLESRLYAIRVLDDDGAGYEDDIIAGVEWCIKNNMDVANMSIGSRDASRAFEEICRMAYNNGLILVAAAGNERYGPSYPAAFEEYVIAVAAVDQDNEHAGFSNIWKTNDISAPGVDIMSCNLGGGYTIMDGTSMATPHVTGTIALALSLFNQDPEYLEDYINKTAQKLNYNGNYDNSWVFGSGLIRADKLLDSIVNSRQFRNALKQKNLF